LDKQYPPTRLLTSRARELLMELVRGHVDHLKAALWDQETAIENLGLDHSSDQAAEPAQPLPLVGLAHRNLALTRELTYARDDNSRPASILFKNLAASIDDVRAAIERIPVTSADNTNTSPESPTPH
jgi:hypothetical protein